MWNAVVRHCPVEVIPLHNVIYCRGTEIMQQDKHFKLTPKLLFHKMKRPRVLSELQQHNNRRYQIAEFFGECIKIDDNAAVRDTIRREESTTKKSKHQLSPLVIRNSTLTDRYPQSLEFTFGASRHPVQVSLSIESTPARDSGPMRPASVKERLRSSSDYRIK